MTKYLALPLFAYAALASSSALAEVAGTTGKSTGGASLVTPGDGSGSGSASGTSGVANTAAAAIDRVIAHESVEAVFASEARNDAWASTLESSIRKVVASDLALLAPNAQVSRVVCQTTICQLQIKRTDVDDGASAPT